MAYLEVSSSTAQKILIGVNLVVPVVAALATAQWGGHIVRSLAQAGLLRTGILAAVQSVAGLILGAFIDKPIINEYLFSNGNFRFAISLIVGSLVSGGTVYAVAALAVKAGLISTSLTLPAVAALVIVPAVVEGAGFFVVDKIVADIFLAIADRRDWIKVQ